MLGTGANAGPGWNGKLLVVAVVVVVTRQPAFDGHGCGERYDGRRDSPLPDGGVQWKPPEPAERGGGVKTAEAWEGRGPGRLPERTEQARIASRPDRQSHGTLNNGEPSRGKGARLPVGRAGFRRRAR